MRVRAFSASVACTQPHVFFRSEVAAGSTVGLVFDVMGIRAGGAMLVGPPQPPALFNPFLFYRLAFFFRSRRLLVLPATHSEVVMMC